MDKILETSFCWLSDDIVRLKNEVGVHEKYAKCNSRYIQKISPHSMLQWDDVMAMVRVAN